MVRFAQELELYLDLAVFPDDVLLPVGALRPGPAAIGHTPAGIHGRFGLQQRIEAVFTLGSPHGIMLRGRNDDNLL